MENKYLQFWKAKQIPAQWKMMVVIFFSKHKTPKAKDTLRDIFCELRAIHSNICISFSWPQKINAKKTYKVGPQHFQNSDSNWSLSRYLYLLSFIRNCIWNPDNTYDNILFFKEKQNQLSFPCFTLHFWVKLGCKLLGVKQLPHRKTPPRKPA